MLFSCYALGLSVPRSTAHAVQSYTIRVLLAGMVLIVFCFASLAQNPDQEEVIRVRTDLITVPVTVLDSRGSGVGGLKQEDFVMLDDGKEVKIGHFSPGTDRVALFFLLDAS